MYAIVRRNTFDPDKLADPDADRVLRAFDQAHAAQPGFIKSIVIDEHDGRRLVVNLWETEEQAAAGVSVLGAQVGRLLGPLMSKPSELIGVGTVIAADPAGLA
jgi:hypothetical protein